MTTRVQAFEQLRRNVALTGLQEKTVASRQKNVRAAVANQLTVVDVFLSGSYRRQTLIGPLSQANVDVIIVLDGKYKERGPRGVLEMVRKSLLSEYPRTPQISRNGQAVTITFSDFIVDVVPAFKRGWWTEGGWDICDSRGDRWIATSPVKDVEMSATANRAHGGHLVPRIKQLKAWNRTAKVPLRSFHLEAQAWSIFGTWWLWATKQPSDWVAARHFFDKARSALKQPLQDPAGTGKDVGAYLHKTALETTVSKVTTAYEGCRCAEECAKNNDLVGMHKAYRQVFGVYYPA